MNPFPRVAILVAIFAGFGLSNNLDALNRGDRPPEKWLEEKMPTEVAGFVVEPYGINRQISYKMDKISYDELDPIGIAAQRFRKGNQVMDAVVIAGNSMESFHDQRWCFVAQGWEVKGSVVVQLDTQSWGKVPATLTQIERPGVQATWAMFIFRGPKGFHPDTPPAAKDFFWNDLTTGKRTIGFSYRFIPFWPGATEQEVITFATLYLDATHKSSGGVF